MSRNFLKALFTVLVIVAFAGTTFAQDENIIRPSTKQGSAAWIFTFGGFAPMTFNGVTIGQMVEGQGASIMGAGFKTYLSDDLALRALLGLSISSSGDADKGGSTSTTSFGLAAGVEMHTQAVYSTSPYIGAQLSFASTSETKKNGTVETKTSGSTFGIGLLAGFDWYFTRGIAVGGEYMLGFASGSASSDNGTTSTDMPGTSAIGISNGGSAHLIVHF